MERKIFGFIAMTLSACGNGHSPGSGSVTDPTATTGTATTGTADTGESTGLTTESNPTGDTGTSTSIATETGATETSTSTTNAAATEASTGEPTGTSSTGTPAMCGNGTIEGDEKCDDANDANDDDCLSDCTKASCGDGYLPGRGGLR